MSNLTPLADTVSAHLLLIRDTLQILARTVPTSFDEQLAIAEREILDAAGDPSHPFAGAEFQRANQIRLQSLRTAREEARRQGR